MQKTSPLIPGETPAALHSVRWLAEHCALPPVDAYPQLAGILLDREVAAAVTHCCWWARHPDGESHFAEATRHLPEMTDADLIAALRRMGYDGFLYSDRSEIIGNLFFQRHGADLHAFSGWVNEQYREKKYYVTFVMDFVAYASQCTDVARARLGSGKHPITERLLAPLMPQLPELGWRASGDGWVDFCRGASARD